MRRIQIASALVTTLAEVYFLTELLWWYFHNGESTLHGAIANAWARLRLRLMLKASIADTLDMIRGLPETDE